MSRKRIVIDTNVLIAANWKDPQRAEIKHKCVERLSAVQEKEVVCLDRNRKILSEYSRHLPNGRQGFGDLFFLWLVNRQYRPDHCEQVELNPIERDVSDFQELAALDENLKTLLDPSDRKFLAVALAHPLKPPVLQATDSKWIGWKKGLAEAGVRIEFIDEEFLQPIYERKMVKKSR